MLRALLLLSICLFSQAEALFWESEQENGIDVAIVLPDGDITINQPIPIQITLSAPAAYSIDENEVRSNLINNLNHVAENITLVEASVKPHKIRYTLSAKIPGKYWINFLTIPLKDDQGNTTYALGTVFPLDVVLSSQTEDSPLAWVQPPAYPHKYFAISVSSELAYKYLNGPDALGKEAYKNRKMVSENIFPWRSLLGTLLALGVAYILLTYLVKAILQSLAKPIDPRKKALDAISDVETREAACYERVSYILKDYIEDVYKVPARAQTTWEIERHLLSRAPFDEHKMRRMIEILKNADLVKFAEKETTDQERSEMVATATQLIRIAKD